MIDEYGGHTFTLLCLYSILRIGIRWSEIHLLSYKTEPMRSFQLLLLGDLQRI